MIKKVLASFEGNIAVGKTTFLRKFAQKLKNQNVNLLEESEQSEPSEASSSKARLGKTTFLHKFEQKLKNPDVDFLEEPIKKSTFSHIHFKPNVDFLEEPVKKWSSIKNEKNEGLLEVFYKDMKRWSYTFQNAAYITRMQDILRCILRSNKKYIFTDRSLQCDKNVFAKMLHDDKKIDILEWNTYNTWNNLFDDMFYGGKYNIIYLRCDPKIAYERMTTRGRDAEKEIPLAYFQSLHEYHDSWLINNKNKDKYNVLILNCDEDFEHNEKKFNDMLNKTIKFILDIEPYDFNKYIHRLV